MCLVFHSNNPKHSGCWYGPVFSTQSPPTTNFKQRFSTSSSARHSDTPPNTRRLPPTLQIGDNTYADLQQIAQLFQPLTEPTIETTLPPQNTMLPTQRPTASPVQTQPLATPVTPPPRVVQNSPMVVTPPSTNRRQLAFHITNKKVVPTNDAIFPRVQNKSTLVQIILQQLQTLLQ